MTDTETAWIGLVEALETNPGDRLARLALADLMEEDGDLDEAAVQRELTDMRLYRDCSKDYDSILELFHVGRRGIDANAGVQETWNDTLCVWTFQVLSERFGCGEEYIISEADGALPLDTMLRKAGY